MDLQASKVQTTSNCRHGTDLKIVVSKKTWKCWELKQDPHAGPKKIYPGRNHMSTISSKFQAKISSLAQIGDYLTKKSVSKYAPPNSQRVMASSPKFPRRPHQLVPLVTRDSSKHFPIMERTCLTPAKEQWYYPSSGGFKPKKKRSPVPIFSM